MYTTFKEIQEKWPIGSIYETYSVPISAWCPTKKDIAVFKTQHPDLIRFECLNNGEIKANEVHTLKVEGYIFDGEYWYPAIQTWDGWETLDI